MSNTISTVHFSTCTQSSQQKIVEVHMTFARTFKQEASAQLTRQGNFSPKTVKLTLKGRFPQRTTFNL